MQRRHSRRCADADILASASIRTCRNIIHVRVYSCPTTGFHGQSVLLAAMWAMYSVLSWTKNLQCERNERCYKLYRLGLYRMVSWFQNRNWKSTFIKQVHYAQLTTLEGCISVRPSVSTATHTAASMSACGRAKNLQMPLLPTPFVSVHTSLVIHYPPHL